MRQRLIYPGFFKNEELATVYPWIRLLFIGLWCISDDDGKIHYSINRIKAEVFPYENHDIEKGLNSLAMTGFIDVEDGAITVLNFGKYQTVEKKFTKPTIEQVKAYAKEVGFPEEKCGAFLDFYESKNWMVGKISMKDWKAAVRTWLRNMGLKPVSKQEVRDAETSRYMYDVDLLTSRVSKGYYPEFLQEKFNDLPPKFKDVVMKQATKEQKEIFNAKSNSPKAS